MNDTIGIYLLKYMRLWLKFYILNYFMFSNYS